MLDKLVEDIGLATSQKIAEAVDGIAEKSQEDRENLISWVNNSYAAYEKKLDEATERLQGAIDDLDSRRQAMYVEETQQIVEKLNELEVVAARLSTIENGKDGEKGEQGLQGEPGLDRPLLEPVYLKDGDYPKSTLGLHNGGLWISTKDAVGDPESDPHAWACILDSMTEMSIDLQEDRSFKLSVRMATGKLIEDTFHIPFPEHKGIWEEGDYSKGDIVTKGHSFWQAMEDTSGEPPGNGWKQILSAPRGKQGPAGKSIEGPQGKPGRNGRDAVLPEGFIEEVMSIATENKRFEDGRSGAEAITSFRGYFDGTESYASGDVVNFDGALYLCTSSAGPSNTLFGGGGEWELMIGVTKQGQEAYMHWQGDWVQKAYSPGMTVRDGGWTMTCVNRTTDRAGPTPIGEPLWIYPGTITPTSVSAKQVLAGARYTAGERAQYVSGYRVYTTTDVRYNIYLVENPLTEPVYTTVSSFTAAATGWQEFSVQGGFIPPFASIDVIAVIEEPATTPVIFSGNWDYSTPPNAEIPPAGTIVHGNSTPSEFRISKTDNDGGDRSAGLENLTIGDGIQGAGMSWIIQAVTDNGTWMNFAVSPSTQGAPDGVQNFDFETVTPTPIPYAEDVDYWLGNSRVSGLYGADTAYVDLTPDDNQYIVDIRLQDFRTSDDWDIVAVSDSAVGSTPASVKVEQFGVITENPTVNTSGAGWTEIKRAAVPNATAYSGTLDIDAKRLDGVGFYSTRLEVLAYEDGGVTAEATHRYELGDNQLSVRIRAEGGDVVFEVKGKAGEDWNWDMIESYREIR